MTEVPDQQTCPPSRADEDSSAEASALFSAGNRHLLENQFQEGADIFTSMLSRGFVHPAVRHNLGLCHELRRDFLGAIRIYTENTVEFPDYPKSYVGLANCYLYAQRVKEAQTALERACELDPTSAQIHILRSECEYVANPDDTKNAIAWHMLGLHCAQETQSTQTSNYAQCYYDSQTGSTYHQFLDGSLLSNNPDFSLVAKELIEKASVTKEGKGKSPQSAQHMPLIVLIVDASNIQAQLAFLQSMKHVQQDDVLGVCLDASARDALHRAFPDVKAMYFHIPALHSKSGQLHAKARLTEKVHARAVARAFTMKTLLQAGHTVVCELSGGMDSDKDSDKDPEAAICNLIMHHRDEACLFTSDHKFVYATPRAAPLFDHKSLPPLENNERLVFEVMVEVHPEVPCARLEKKK